MTWGYLAAGLILTAGGLLLALIATIIEARTRRPKWTPDSYARLPARDSQKGRA